jgi:hypothetical protein
MKYIKLFEEFSFEEIKESSNQTGLTFEWIPYDEMINNSINERIPKEAYSLSEAISILEENPEFIEAGLYICHERSKNGEKGSFGRILVPAPEDKSLENPFLAETFTEFNSDENNLNKERLHVNKAMSAVKQKSPLIFNEIVRNFGDEEKSNIVADLGDLGF